MGSVNGCEQNGPCRSAGPQHHLQQFPRLGMNLAEAADAMKRRDRCHTPLAINSNGRTGVEAEYLQGGPR